MCFMTRVALHTHAARRRHHLLPHHRLWVVLTTDSGSTCTAAPRRPNRSAAGSSPSGATLPAASAGSPPSTLPAAMAGGSSSKKRRSRSKRKRERKPNPATQLTDDLLVDILSRVPYRSLCRFRCVSTRWRTLISDPYYQRRLPQTLAGIFHRGPSGFNAGGSSESTRPVRYCFANVSGTGQPPIDPSFRFLPEPDREPERLRLMDSCNGLLLCRNFRNLDEGLFDYLVLNPATEECVVVPVSWRSSGKVLKARLGFDPAFSSHFYIFEFQLDWNDEYHALVVKIYSSETRVWCHKQSGWSFEIFPFYDYKSVFVNGVLYVIANGRLIGSVDVKGETWRIIDFPGCKVSIFHGNGPRFIGLSQGRLHLANENENDMVGDKLAIWVLEDKDSNEWTLKHTVCCKHLVGREDIPFDFEFIVVAIHPHRNMVFFVFGDENTLTSYDMDSGSVHFIRNLGHIYPDSEYFQPYIPLFSKSLPDAAKQ